MRACHLLLPRTNVLASASAWPRAWAVVGRPPHTRSHYSGQTIRYHNTRESSCCCLQRSWCCCRRLSHEAKIARSSRPSRQPVQPVQPGPPLLNRGLGALPTSRKGYGSIRTNACSGLVVGGEPAWGAAGLLCRRWPPSPPPPSRAARTRNRTTASRTKKRTFVVGPAPVVYVRLDRFSLLSPMPRHDRNKRSETIVHLQGGIATFSGRTTDSK